MFSVYSNFQLIVFQSCSHQFKRRNISSNIGCFWTDLPILTLYCVHQSGKFSGQHTLSPIGPNVTVFESLKSSKRLFAKGLWNGEVEEVWCLLPPSSPNLNCSTCLQFALPKNPKQMFFENANCRWPSLDQDFWGFDDIRGPPFNSEWVAERHFKD